MKTFLLTCFALLICITVSNAQDVHWPLNVDANDTVGTQHGTPNGGVSFVNDKVRGQVANFDGDSGFVQLPVGLMENVTDVTITCYFKWAGGAAWQRVFSFGNALPDVRTLYLCPMNGWDGDLHLTLGGPYGKWTDLTPRPIKPDVWYFAAVVKKADSLLLYLNDQLIAADTTFLVPGDLFPDSANWLGKSHWPDATFNGMIDDVRLYKSALTEEEVMELYTPQYEEAWWPLDNNANDELGTQHGITNEGVSFVNDQIRGQVMQLDGESGFVQLPVGLMESVNDVTITCYFKWAGGNAWQRVFSFGNALPDVRTLYLCPMNGWAGDLHLTLGGPYGKWTDLTPRPINPDIWYFAAVVKKADSLLLYLNDQ
ncbi:MAG: laminin G domain-containing protein, partial [Bacteroidales bacterium]